MSSLQEELQKALEQGDFSTWMMDHHHPIISIMESLQNEKQIMVDPLSLKGFHSPTTKHTMLPTIVTNSSSTLFNPPPLQPPKERFLSMSLPNSANSSPRSGSAFSKKESKGGSPEPQFEGSNFDNKLQILLQEVQLMKSKSFGEARENFAPFEEFDHWLAKPSAAVEQVKLHHGNNKFSKTEAVKGSPKSSNKSISKHMKKPSEDEMKCSALCLYLPGFGGKVKPVKTRKEELKKEAVMSRTVSLENFECGSWASAAMSHEVGGDSVNNNYYFDLPIELMKNNAGSEACSPVKGRLKNSSSRGSARKSDMSSPHQVRFSTPSSPSCPASPASTCITPRLRKARDDFNAFLAAAQTA